MNDDELALVWTGDVDPGAQALAARIGGVASVRLPGFGNREFDVVSDTYVCQTTGAASAWRRPRNYLNLKRRTQIRETLRAAQVTGREALFEFTAGAPDQEIVDFIHRNALDIGVRVSIVVTEEPSNDA